MGCKTRAQTDMHCWKVVGPLGSRAEWEGISSWRPVHQRTLGSFFSPRPICVPDTFRWAALFQLAWHTAARLRAARTMRATGSALIPPKMFYRQGYLQNQCLISLNCYLRCPSIVTESWLAQCWAQPHTHNALGRETFGCARRLCKSSPPGPKHADTCRHQMLFREATRPVL